MVTPTPEFDHQIIRASAGTGKTFALSNRYLRLLAAGVDCQSILATTFSRKGAGEILDRIVGRLSAAALNSAMAKQLSEELDVQLDQESAAGILHNLLGNLHRLEISTLDSFFNRVAKAFSLELGLPPTWDIVEEQQIAQLEDRSIQTVLEDNAVDTLLHMLSRGEANRRVATMIRDVVHRVYQVYRESGPEPWDQLSKQGHRLTDDQVISIIDEMKSLEMPTKSLGTHWDKVIAHAESEDWNEFIRDNTSFQNFLDGNLKYSRTKLPPAVVAIYQKLLPHCQSIASNQLIQRNIATRDLLGAFGVLLEHSKDVTGQLRFDDVTERLKNFVAMWDTDRFSFRLDHQIQHLLLDEFQDTSPVQWKVIYPFAKKVVATEDSQRSFFCVGDMKQAIFGWRGGVAEIFDLVDKSLPNLNQLSLAKSYRSSPEVIGLINDVFGHVDKYSCNDELCDEAIQQWAQWFTEHSTNHQTMPGFVSVEMASDCDRQAKSFSDRKDRLRNDNVLEATVVRVRQLARTMPDHQSIGVLVRTNRQVSELIFKLRQRGVHASEEGGSALTDSACVQLILSAIQLADHPGDGLARFHLSHSPLANVFGLSPEHDQNQTAIRAAAQAGAANLRKRLVHEGFGPVIESLARQLLEHATARETKRLQQLTRVAYDHSDARQWQLRPRRFVEFIRDDVKVSDESSARVRVMTIHKSKGLEFDAVVLPYPLTSEGWAGHVPDVVVGRQSPTAPIEIASRYAGAEQRKLLPVEFQSMFEADRQRNVRESMCVLYVALTRAVHSVYMVLSFGAKPDHKSPAGILMATLCPDQKREEGVLYQSGNPEWYKSTDDPVANDDPFQLKSFYLSPDISFDPEGISTSVCSGRGLPSFTPSTPEGANQVQLSKLFEAKGDQYGMLRGTMLHGCFELVQWLDEAIPSRQELARHLKSLEPSVRDVDSFLTDFHAAIEHKNVNGLLSRISYQTNYLMDFSTPDEVTMEATRLEVQTERRFAVETENGFTQGVIDRLILIFRGDTLVAADIIDLKTDDVQSAGLHDRVIQYRSQVSSYRDAAALFLNLPVERISTRLVFLGSGQIVNVDVVDGVVLSGATAKRRKPQYRRGGTDANGRRGNADPTVPGKPKRKPEQQNSPSESEPPKPNLLGKPTRVQKTLWDD
ncbi:MAG: UvrD-helicase domain-containing protein [Planctomycetota bacterium]